MSQTYLSVHNTPDVASYYAALSFISPCEKLLFDRYIPPGAAVLDLGVGGGRTTAYLAPRSSCYVGIDYADEMVRACQAKFPEVDIRQADASDLSGFSSSSFDVVVMAFNGIDSLPEKGRHRCFDECFRVLRPGGVFIFSAHNVRAVLVAPVWNKDRVRELAKRTSFGVAVVRYAITGLVCTVVFARATLRAAWASARRLRRLTNRAFWRGEGYMLDSTYGGFIQHYSVPKYVIPEVEAHGFHLREMEGSEYPATRGELYTRWYYYAFQKPVSN